MRILFLSRHYWPEPCDTRESQLAALMAASGHHATALTTYPNYPNGKVYRGYEQCIVEKETRDGVTIVRVPMIMENRRTRLRRTVSRFSFFLTSLFLGVMFTRRPEIVWIQFDSLSTAFAGYLLAKMKRAPFVIEISDLDPIRANSASKPRSFPRVAKFLFHRASRIVVPSPCMKSHMSEHGVPTNKVDVIYKWADEQTFRPTVRHEMFGNKFGLNRVHNIVLAGDHEVAESLDTVLDAAKRLSDEPRLQFVFVGSGPETARLLERAAKERIDNVRFIPHQNRSQMPNILAWGDAMLLHRAGVDTVPAKTQTYMASGKPILCGVAGETMQIVEDARCGIVFEPGSSESLVGAVREFLLLSEADREAMGANSRVYYEQNFSQQTLAKVYSQLFAKIVGPQLVLESVEQESTLQRAA